MAGANSQAIDILVQTMLKMAGELVESSRFDKTKPGRIEASLGNNKYSVRIEGTVYTVPSVTSDTYAVNDVVSVLYPENDIKRKRIIGREA